MYCLPVFSIGMNYFVLPWCLYVCALCEAQPERMDCLYCTIVLVNTVRQWIQRRILEILSCRPKYEYVHIAEISNLSFGSVNIKYKTALEKVMQREDIKLIQA
jgi:hypothetical protein